MLICGVLRKMLISVLNENMKMMTLTMKFLYWLPRVLCILAILFISLFALDAFEPGLSIWEQIQAFLIHMIPSFVLAAILVVAWNWELIGGSIFLLLGLGFTPWVFRHNYSMNGSLGTTLIVVATITFPFVLVGGLFLLHHLKSKKHIP